MNYFFGALTILTAALLSIQLLTSTNEDYDRKTETLEGYEIQKISCIETFSPESNNKELKINE